MQSSLLLTLVIPAGLIFIMFSLGLSLTIEDFKRVLVYPKAMVTGLLCQMLVLPVICFLIIKAAGLRPELAAGLMILSATPGGTAANLYSFFAKGDVALNVTLTAVNSLLILVTLPFITDFAIHHFLNDVDGAVAVALPFKKVAQLVLMVTVPVAAGMLVKYKLPLLTERLQKPFKLLSVLILLFVITGAVFKEKENIAANFQQVGLAALAFNVLSLTVGFFIPRLLRIERKQAIAIAMESGIHNGALAVYVTMQLLGSSLIGLPSVIYSLIMFFTAAAFGLLVNLKK